MIKDDEMLRLEDDLRKLLGITPEECPIFYEKVDSSEMECVEEDDETPDFFDELKRAAWNITRENPGIDRSEWIDELIRQYPSEVVDALGTDPFEVFHLLEDMWDCNDYEDPKSGECLSFRDWSEFFANDPEYLRDELDKAHTKICDLEAEIVRLQNIIKSHQNETDNEPDNG